MPIQHLLFLTQLQLVSNNHSILLQIFQQLYHTLQYISHNLSFHNKLLLYQCNKSYLQDQAQLLKHKAREPFRNPLLYKPHFLNSFQIQLLSSMLSFVFPRQVRMPLLQLTSSFYLLLLSFVSQFLIASSYLRLIPFSSFNLLSYLIDRFLL